MYRSSNGYSRGVGILFFDYYQSRGYCIRDYQPVLKLNHQYFSHFPISFTFADQRVYLFLLWAFFNDVTNQYTTLHFTVLKHSCYLLLLNNHKVILNGSIKSIS